MLGLKTAGFTGTGPAVVTISLEMGEEDIFLTWVRVSGGCCVKVGGWCDD
jgi:shikimate kinase